MVGLTLWKKQTDGSWKFVVDLEYRIRNQAVRS